MNVFVGSRASPRRLATLLAALVLLQQAAPRPVLAEPSPAASQPASQNNAYNVEQLDALLAPIALYPDQLLTQVLMASTFPLDIVEASRWLQDPTHKALKGGALAKAVAPLSWDPSVKSLVAFPEVLSRLNNNLGWTQQLGDAFANQQKDVLDSVQRLRRQAQEQGHLNSSSQQVVSSAPPAEGNSTQTIIIEPASPSVVYVPSYSPTVVYGAWPYPAVPPVVAVPSPGYVAGTALLGGLAFGAGVAVSSSLWGWSSPNWSHGDVNINASRYNNINTNRQRTMSRTWSPTLNRSARQGAAFHRPAGGPVGRPTRSGGLPANAIGRRNVTMPANLLNRPASANRPHLSASNRPNLSPGSRPRPAVGSRPVTNRGQFQRPQPRAAGAPAWRGRGQQGGAGAFSGMGQGSRAAGFGQRGAQSWQQGRVRSGAGRNAGGFQGRSHGGFHGRR